MILAGKRPPNLVELLVLERPAKDSGNKKKSCGVHYNHRERHMVTRRKSWRWHHHLLQSGRFLGIAWSVQEVAQLLLLYVTSLSVYSVVSIDKLRLIIPRMAPGPGTFEVQVPKVYTSFRMMCIESGDSLFYFCMAQGPFPGRIGAGLPCSCSSSNRSEVNEWLVIQIEFAPFLCPS